MKHPLPRPWYRDFKGSQQPTGAYVFCCEHATNHFGPRPASGTDRALLDTHWAVDLGVAKLTELLVQDSDGIGIFATYSRLLLDPNRTLDSASLIVESIEGKSLICNKNLDASEREYRIECLHRGYHDGLNAALTERLARGPVGLVSMHSFTPIWAGVPRDVEIGVLFDRNDQMAEAMVEHLISDGFQCKANEPYSGRTGELMYAANRHGRFHEVPYIEFEVRQDLITNHEDRVRISTALHKTLDAFMKPEILG